MSQNNIPDLSDNESCFTNGSESALNVSFESLASDRFSNITLLYSSCSGPMQLYTATRYGKRYILKCLKDEYKNDPVYRLALRKEFEIGMTLDHPDIRRTIGFEEVENLGYALILEYIDGENLEDAINKGIIDSKDINRIIIHLASALDYIHAHQVVHRDIKPSNIMITHSGKGVKLIDFSLSDSEAFIILKNPAGTRKYMSPEQFKNESKASPKSDIYSFGMTIRDLEAVNNDRYLKHLSEMCCNNDPEKRPKANEIISRLKKMQLNRSRLFSIDSPKLTYLLIGVIVLLSLFVIFLFNNRYKNDISSTSVESSETSNDSSEIHVLDLSLINDITEVKE